MPRQRPLIVRGKWPAALLLAATAFAGAGAQAIGSAPRAITLIAVKRPAFEALDAARVTTVSSQRSESGTGFDVSASVDVHDEGRCEIRAVSRESAPILLYRGMCHEASPSHAVRLQVGALPRPGADDIAIEVVCVRGGVPRKWLLDLPLSASAPGWSNSTR